MDHFMTTADQGSQAKASLWLPPLGRLCVLEKFADGSPTPTSFEFLYRYQADPRGYFVFAEGLANVDLPNGYSIHRKGYSRFVPHLWLSQVRPIRVQWRYATDQDLALVISGMREGREIFRGWLERGGEASSALWPEERMRLSMVIEQRDRSLWGYSHRALTNASEDAISEPSHGEWLLYVRDYGAERGLVAHLCTLTHVMEGVIELRSWLALTLGRYGESRIVDISHIGTKHHTFFYSRHGAEPDDEGARHILRRASMEDMLILARCCAYRLASPSEKTMNIRAAIQPRVPRAPSEPECARFARVLDLYFPEPTPEGAV